MGRLHGNTCAGRSCSLRTNAGISNRSAKGADIGRASLTCEGTPAGQGRTQRVRDPVVVTRPVLPIEQRWVEINLDDVVGRNHLLYREAQLCGGRRHADHAGLAAGAVQTGALSLARAALRCWTLEDAVAPAAWPQFEYPTSSSPARRNPGHGRSHRSGSRPAALPAAGFPNASAALLGNQPDDSPPAEIPQGAAATAEIPKRVVLGGWIAA